MTVELSKEELTHIKARTMAFVANLREENKRLADLNADLLAALKATVGVFEGHEDVPLYVRKARAAIAKAEGTS